MSGEVFFPVLNMNVRELQWNTYISPQNYKLVRNSEQGEILIVDLWGLGVQIMKQYNLTLRRTQWLIFNVK